MKAERAVMFSFHVDEYHLHRIDDILGGGIKQ